MVNLFRMGYSVLPVKREARAVAVPTFIKKPPIRMRGGYRFMAKGREKSSSESINRNMLCIVRQITRVLTEWMNTVIAWERVSLLWLPRTLVTPSSDRSQLSQYANIAFQTPWGYIILDLPMAFNLRHGINRQAWQLPNFLTLPLPSFTRKKKYHKVVQSIQWNACAKFSEVLVGNWQR